MDESVRRRLKRRVAFAFQTAGAVALVGGVFLVSPVAAVIITGAAMLTVGILWEKGEK